MATMTHNYRLEQRAKFLPPVQLVNAKHCSSVHLAFWLKHAVSYNRFQFITRKKFSSGENSRSVDRCRRCVHDDEFIEGVRQNRASFKIAFESVGE